ncbi:hypothetical protein [Bradyrhizobium valentinum]|uniref:hypothetical protein n=1 Tax=Bradyrhizobium valentinum TaxID=1518501 RepID=UPI00070CA988|nr:hypothetical protein [Bradyrhizobium valentinum]KRQ93931.1 hypothetical protein CQ10_34845 [Bradyrhizobium valentinum]
MAHHVIASKTVAIKDKSVIERVTFLDSEVSFSWRVCEISVDRLTDYNERKYSGRLASITENVLSAPALADGKGFEPDAGMLRQLTQGGRSYLDQAAKLWLESRHTSIWGSILFFGGGALVVLGLSALMALLFGVLVRQSAPFPDRVAFIAYWLVVVLIWVSSLSALLSGISGPLPQLSKLWLGQFVRSLAGLFKLSPRPFKENRLVIGGFLQQFAMSLIWYTALTNSSTIAAFRTGLVYSLKLQSDPVFGKSPHTRWALSKITAFERRDRVNSALREALATARAHLAFPVMLTLLLLGREHLTVVSGTLDFILLATTFALIPLYLGWIVGVPLPTQVSVTSKLPIVAFVSVAVAHLVALGLLNLHAQVNLNGQPLSSQVILDVILDSVPTYAFTKALCVPTLSCGSTFETLLRIAFVGFYVAIFKNVISSAWALWNGPSDPVLVARAALATLLDASTHEAREQLAAVRQPTPSSISVEMECDIRDSRFDEALALAQSKLIILKARVVPDVSMTLLIYGMFGHDLHIDHRISLYKFARKRGMSHIAWLNVVEVMEQVYGADQSDICEVWWKLFPQTGDYERYPAIAELSLRIAAGLKIEQAEFAARIGDLEHTEPLQAKLLKLRAELFGSELGDGPHMRLGAFRTAELERQLHEIRESWQALQSRDMQAMAVKYLVNTQFLRRAFGEDDAIALMNNCAIPMYIELLKSSDVSTAMLLWDHEDLLEANAEAMRSGGGLFT